MSALLRALCSLFLLVALLLLPVATSNRATAANGDLSWRTLPPMPTARDGLAAVTVGGRIYAIGGDQGSVLYVGDGRPTPRPILATVEEFDPTTAKWTARSPMPTARTGHSVVAVGDRIYAIGGFDGRYLNSVEEYDSGTDTWRYLADMPTARASAAAAVVDGKILIIGGQNDRPSALAVVEEYNPASNTWRSRRNLPSPRAYFVAATAGGKVYTFGGIDLSGGSYTSSTLEFTPSSNVWISRGSLPGNASPGGAVTVGGSVYVLSSDDIAQPYRIDEFDSTTYRWKAWGRLPTKRLSLTAAAVENRVFAIGGSVASGYETASPETAIVEEAVVPIPVAAPTPTPQPTGAPRQTPPAHSNVKRVSLFGNAVSPRALRVSPGTSVIWRNGDRSAHHLIGGIARGANGQRIEFGLFGLNVPLSGRPAPAASGQRPAASESPPVVFSQPGQYAYRCSLHPRMTGTIVVR